MTFKILTNDTHKIIYCSNLRLARDPNAQNLRIDPLNTTSPEVIHSLRTASPALDHGEDLLPLSLDDSGYNKQDHLAIVDPYELVGCTFLMDPQDDGQRFRARIVDLVEDPYELVGCTFLMDPQDDGQRFRARIVDLVEDRQSKVRKSDHHHKFRILVNDDQYEEVITYNELMDFIQKNEMMPLSGIFGESSDTKDHFFALIPTTRVLNSMLWLNGRMGRLQQSHYLS
jgi:hypothetical protein